MTGGTRSFALPSNIGSQYPSSDRPVTIGRNGGDDQLVTSINDIIRAIREDPEARDELRRVLLTDELLAMPQRLSELVTVVTRQGQDIEVLKNDMGYVKGKIVETSLQGRIISFLSSRLNLRRATIVRGPVRDGIAHEFEDAIEDASDRDEIAANQRERIYSTDVIVRARRRETGETVYVPVEASFTIDYSDVDRAANTAIALRQVFPGVDVAPAVYGRSSPRAALHWRTARASACS